MAKWFAVRMFAVMLGAFLLGPTAWAGVFITDLSVTPAGDLQVGDTVNFNAQALSDDGASIYYRFDLISNYGTDQYDPFNGYQTLQDFSPAAGCSHTFNAAGHYIVIVYASTTTGFTGQVAAIMGMSVSVGMAAPVRMETIDIGIIQSPKAGEPVTISVQADHLQGAGLEYRFDLVSQYGTSQYDPYNGYQTLQHFSGGSSITHTFTSPGGYIIVVYAVEAGQGFGNATPIVGGSIFVESDGGSSIGNFTGNQEFDLADAEQTDALYGFRTDTPLSGAIPDRVDYSDKMPTVRDQGSTGSCTAWSTAYYYKTYHEVMEMGWDKNANAFSPMYLYSMQCRLFDQPWDFIRAWEVLNRYGCAKDATFPFQDLPDNDEKGQYAQVWISDAVNDEARNYRCGERTQLYDLNQVKQALTRSPVLLGINNYNANLRSPSPENNYITYDPFNWNAGHAILCVGYDDSKFGVGALKFVNSWGRDWAIDGFSWLRYSDFSDIVLFAMTINDLPNAGGADSATSRPAAPSDVRATDAAGPYVDVAWSRVAGAQYYRIYRASVGDSSTYKEIGSTYEPYFRDYPAPGIAYYYSVVSHNDIGSSAHYASDTDGKGYVDQGSARGASMAKPVVSWTSNDDGLIRSNFSVSNIDATATAMEIFVGSASAGPWKSFGWIAPGTFYITWGEDSEYIGRKPFVKVLVSNVEGFSETSDPTQVGATIVGTTTIAAVTSLTATADGGDIRLNWATDGGQADVFEIWRWLASEDTGGEWILVDVLDGDARVYYDGTAAPGKYYYYAVGAGYQGAYGEYLILDDPVQVAVSTANLYLYEIYYDAGLIFNPAEFELTVWNDGGTVFSDYSIHINVYDFDDGEFYRPFEPFYASEVAGGGQLPLYPGDYHTLQFGKYIPAAYGDGHYYAWIIWVDWYEEYDELYEDDNWIICDEGWWAYDWTLSALAGSSEAATPKLKLESAPMRLMDIGQTASVGPVARPERTDKIRVSSRPFSAKTPVGAILPGGFVRIPESAESLMKSVGKTESKAGPIRFKKPEFNVDHGK